MQILLRFKNAKAVNPAFTPVGKTTFFFKTVTIDSRATRNIPIKIHYLWDTIHYTYSHRGSLSLN